MTDFKSVTPDISIVILNWNGWKDTIECLESFYQINYTNYCIIVLDNASKDDSILKIKDYCNGKIKVESKFFNYKLDNKPIELFELTEKESESLKTIKNEFLALPSDRKLILIKNNKNYGFAAGNNIGIRFSLDKLHSKFILFLNNDVVVDPDFLAGLIKPLMENSGNVISGPTILFYDEPNKIQSAGAFINWHRGTTTMINGNNKIKEMNYNVINVDCVSGCALLTKSNLFQQIGLFDPQYFLFWEETDLCVRAQKKGYNIVRVPESKIWHKVSASTKNSSEIWAYYMTLNTFYFINKNSTKKNYVLFLLYFFSCGLWIRIIIFIYKNNFKSSFQFFKAIKDFFEI